MSIPVRRRADALLHRTRLGMVQKEIVRWKDEFSLYDH